MINIFKKFFNKLISILFKPDSKFYTDTFRIKFVVKKMFKKNSVRTCKKATVPASENQINLNSWLSEKDTKHNLGDWLSPIIVNYMLNERGIDFNKKVSKTKHLYAIGSVLLDWKDATVWGSGFLVDRPETKVLLTLESLHRFWHKTDIRAVRGPKTKEYFDKLKIKCPETFGDPGLLLPRFYTPNVEKSKKYVIIPHLKDYEYFKASYSNTISIVTDDWQATVDEICSAKLVISSSLHGIILAEAYGIPAVLMKTRFPMDLFKYNDYYYSTGRREYPIAETVENALLLTPSLPDKQIINKIQDQLYNAFPYDLWEC